MEIAHRNYTPNDEFTLYIHKISIDRFEIDFAPYMVGKDLRNAYDNRLRPRNFQMYYMVSLIDELTKKVQKQEKEIKRYKDKAAPQRS